MLIKPAGTLSLLAGRFHSKSFARRLGTVTHIPVITDGATTFGLSEGVLSNLYENVWKTPGQLTITDRGIVRLSELFEADHVTARGIISDHASV